jgi:GNAT superfamily N-acetyltransferase
VLLLDGRPVGRLWVAWPPDACVLVDMILLPEHRRAGLGTLVVADVLAEADRRSVPVRLTVERTNAPSLAFCARLGFSETGGDEVYVRLERPVRLPPASA